MDELIDVALDDVHVPPRRRPMRNASKLAASIAEIGLLQPIVLTPDHVLVSGLNRLEAFRLLKLEAIPALIRSFDSLHLEMAEIDENLIREELTALERAEAEKRHKDIYEALHPAVKHGGAPGKAGGGKKAKDALSASLVPSATEDIAARSGRSTRSVQEDTLIATHLPEKTREALHDTDLADQQKDLLKLARMFKRGEVGKAEALVEIVQTEDCKSLSEASSLLYKREHSPAPDVPMQADAWELKEGDAHELLLQLKDETFDLILTDPPYGKEALPLYALLLKQAERLLKPGGSLLVMTGQILLPQVLDIHCEQLTYQWVIAYLTPGPSTQVWGTSIASGWKPVLWFSKARYTGDKVADVVRSDSPDKRFTDWGQDEQAFGQLVYMFSRQGQRILDPFCGAGTTGIAAVRLGRTFLGIDSDQAVLKFAAGRLEKEIFSGEKARENTAS